MLIHVLNVCKIQVSVVFCTDGKASICVSAQTHTGREPLARSWIFQLEQIWIQVVAISKSQTTPPWQEIQKDGLKLASVWLLSKHNIDAQNQLGTAQIQITGSTGAH
jgi:hypothetical protein